jgi:hypothetical protein
MVSDDRGSPGTNLCRFSDTNTALPGPHEQVLKRTTSGADRPQTPTGRVGTTGALQQLTIDPSYGTNLRASKSQASGTTAHVRLREWRKPRNRGSPPMGTPASYQRHYADPVNDPVIVAPAGPVFRRISLTGRRPTGSSSHHHVGSHLESGGSPPH